MKKTKNGIWKIYNKGRNWLKSHQSQGDYDTATTVIEFAKSENSCQ